MKTQDYWQLQDAKNKLSQVVHMAEERAQYITVRGKPAVVVVSVEEYERLTRPHASLVDFVRSGLLDADDLDWRRQDDRPRDVDL